MPLPGNKIVTYKARETPSDPNSNVLIKHMHLLQHFEWLGDLVDEEEVASPDDHSAGLAADDGLISVELAGTVDHLWGLCPHTPGFFPSAE